MKIKFNWGYQPYMGEGIFLFCIVDDYRKFVIDLVQSDGKPYLFFECIFFDYEYLGKYLGDKIIVVGQSFYKNVVKSKKGEIIIQRGKNED